MNTELLLAAKKVVQRFEREWSGVGGGTHLAEEVKVLKRLVIKAEEDLDREAMWYEHQRQNADREYNEMMLRGDE